MKIPRDVNGSEAVRALRRAGYEPHFAANSLGLISSCEKKSGTVVVPQHKPIKPGTLKGMIEQAGLTVEEFVKLL